MKGIAITLPNGEELEIPEDERRVYGAIWKNGMVVETYVYGEDEAPNAWDVIGLRVRSGSGRVQSFFMDIEDAVSIISGLSRAIEIALEKRVSPWPADKAE